MKHVALATLGAVERREWTRTTAWIAATCALVGFVLRIGLALHSPNIEHPDEVYQTIETAYRINHGLGIISWEFEHGFRSWEIAFLLAGVEKSVEAIWPGAYLPYEGAVVVGAMFSLLPIWAAAGWGVSVGGAGGALVCGLMTAVWFDGVYYGGKVKAEGIGGALLLFALYLLYPLPKRVGWRRAALIGVITGGAVLVRVQLAPAAAVFLAVGWLAMGRRFRPVIFSFFVTMLAGLALDWRIWGSPLYGHIQYMLQGWHAAIPNAFGIAPPAYYAEEIWSRYGRSVLPLIVLIATGGVRLPLVALLALASAAPHQLMDHKEYRYLLPALHAASCLGGVGAVTLASRLSRMRDMGMGMAAISIIICGGSFTLGRSEHMLRYWRQSQGLIAGVQRISQLRDACGLGVLGAPWDSMPGYSVLQKAIPLEFMEHRAEVVPKRKRFNYLLTRQVEVAEWDKIREFPGEIRLYRRDGACEGGEVVRYAPRYRGLEGILEGHYRRVIPRLAGYER